MSAERGTERRSTERERENGARDREREDEREGVGRRARSILGGARPLSGSGQRLLFRGGALCFFAGSLVRHRKKKSVCVCARASSSDDGELARRVRKGIPSRPRGDALAV